MQYFWGGNYKDYHFNQTGRFWNANIEFIKEHTEIEPGIRLITTSSPYMGYFNEYTSLDTSENLESHNAKLNGLFYNKYVIWLIANSLIFIPLIRPL